MLIQIQAVIDYFEELQQRVCDELASLEPGEFSKQTIQLPGKGYSRPRVLAEGEHIEKAAVQFSYSIGDQLPPAASERHCELAGLGFEATSISMIVHPRNPYAPTMHANLRFFLVGDDHWHFGGGLDLTPYYGFKEDAVHWHQQARQACREYGDEIYSLCKRQCDEYFYLPHRDEPRGIGGLFFDDWDRGGFDASFRFVRDIGDHILPAYMPIIKRRIGMPYSDDEREFQLYRRGRYAEFNLAIDRGTRYGLQSGRRIESVLASLPPMVAWRYDWQPEPGSREAELLAYYLQPRDWLSDNLD